MTGNPYITDEAVTAAYAEVDAGSATRVRNALTAAAPHIIAAAEPAIRADERERTLREIARDWDADLATGYNNAVTEAAEGRGPAAAAALRWAADVFQRRSAETYPGAISDTHAATARSLAWGAMTAETEEQP